MSKPSSCPDSSQLKALLESRLPADRQEELTRHLDSCEECQHDLELLATGAGTLPKCLKHIDREQPVADSAYWPAVQTLEKSQTLLLPSADTPPAAGGPAKLLHFLSPSENIGHLGRLGQFEVVREVGRGGMGVVLHGIDDCLQRDVAIKVLDPLLAHDEVARKRFCREARAAASVTHENVVAVHQVEEDEGSGLPYLVMQLVVGGSLEDRLGKEGPLELTEVVRIGLHGLRTAS